jgi:hypothetical protein
MASRRRRGLTLNFPPYFLQLSIVMSLFLDVAGHGKRDADAEHSVHLPQGAWQRVIATEEGSLSIVSPDAHQGLHDSLPRLRSGPLALYERRQAGSITRRGNPGLDALRVVHCARHATDRDDFCVAQTPTSGFDDVSSSSTFQRLFGPPQSDEDAASASSQHGPPSHDGTSQTDSLRLEPVSKLFSFNDPAINALLLQSFGGTSDWVKSLLGSASQLESDQMHTWFQFGRAYFAAQGFGDSPLLASEEISQFVRNVIAQHRFAHSCGTIYRIRLGIAGPRFSGKSRLLHSFADEIMLEYAATGLWKRTFFVMFNFRLLSPFLSDMNDFYAAIVDITLQNLVWQRPALQQFHLTVKKFLLLVTTSKSCPRIPVHGKFFLECQHFALALQKIVEKLFAVWTEPDAMADWLLNVFLLPSFVSTAAGFSNVFYFADNIEFADLDLTASIPFVDSNQSCFVAEFFKFVLSRGNFIVVAENQDKLPEILQPLEHDGLNLMPDIEIITPAGILNKADPRTIFFDIQEESMPLQLTAEHCSGIPAFVALWDELNAAFDEFEQVPADEKDEFQALLTAQAQHVIDVLFAVPDSGPPLFVTSVRKKEAV